MNKRLAKKVLLLGWDAADWKIIHPLLDAGLMPSLASLINKGVMGDIATLDPVLSPILWTSIATGKTGDKHGILNFVEPVPDKMEVRPVTSTSRKCKAFWNILSQNNLKSNVVGWWPSNPVEPINGTMVSNFFQKITAEKTEDWKLPEGSIHPKRLTEILSEYRIHPTELTGEHILPFVPKAHLVDQQKDKYLSIIGKNIAECASTHAAATWLMENEPWDLTAVYFDTIDHLSHGFMKYHPPQMQGIADDKFDLYQDVVNGIYRFHDMMLERYIQLAGEDTTIIILSDHGFHSDHLRPKRLPTEPMAPALEHRQFGMFCISGPNIQKDERIYGATLLDITPTILTLFGLPVGKDMDGKVLTHVFDNPVIPSYIDSWENVDGNAGNHPTELQEDPIAAAEAMKQLIELGYIETPSEDKAKTVERVVNETQFNLARIYLFKEQSELAEPILESLYQQNTTISRYGLKYVECLLKSKKTDRCVSVIEQLKTLDKKDLPQLDYLEAILLVSQNKPRKAIPLFKKAMSTISHMPEIHVKVGEAFIKLREWEEAKNAFTKALEIDYENAAAHTGLGIASLRTDELDKALDHLLNAVSLIFNNAQAHYFLGEAFYRLKMYDRAVEAFKVATTYQPGNRKAHSYLVKLYTEHVMDSSKAEIHSNFIKNNIKGTITIVSGLPRSGTSMMMQMLAAGGLNILTDNIRATDENNPKGYLEYQKVKSLAHDNSWLHEGQNKVVKVIAQLLQFLPANYQYKVVFMEREMEEVIQSQQIMLGKKADVEKKVYPTSLADTFKKQLEKTQSWIKNHPQFEVTFISYSDVIQNPQEIAENLSLFLDSELNIEKMVQAVDRNLYRNKKSV
ncbi:MAG: alkaline phosphatase family protein [Bacteroidetes bacterium]|nr:alkaline phosphatase family protein [Bacteroidota bacterium]